MDNTTVASSDTAPAPIASERDTWPPLFRRAIESTERSLARELEHLDRARVLEPILAEHPDISPILCYYSSFIEITVYVKDLKDVVALIRQLRLAGYEHPRINDNPSLKRREYRMGSLTINAYIPDESKTCRFIQVGTEVVPVYAMKCDEVTDEVSTPEVAVSHEITPDNEPRF